MNQRTSRVDNPRKRDIHKDLQKIVAGINQRDQDQREKEAERRRKQDLTASITPMPSPSPSKKRKKLDVYEKVKNVTRCRVCKKVFNNKSSMFRHFRTEHQKKTVYLYECANCAREFKQISSYYRHRRNQHMNSPDCGFRKTVYNERDDDMSNYKPEKCTKCNMRFTRKDNLIRHVREQHPKQKEPLVRWERFNKIIDNDPQFHHLEGPIGNPKKKITLEEYKTRISTKPKDKDDLTSLQKKLDYIEEETKRRRLIQVKEEMYIGRLEKEKHRVVNKMAALSEKSSGGLSLLKSYGDTAGNKVQKQQEKYERARGMSPADTPHPKMSQAVEEMSQAVPSNPVPYGPENYVSNEPENQVSKGIENNVSKGPQGTGTTSEPAHETDQSKPPDYFSLERLSVSDSDSETDESIDEMLDLDYTITDDDIRKMEAYLTNGDMDELEEGEIRED